MDVKLRQYVDRGKPDLGPPAFVDNRAATVRQLKQIAASHTRDNLSMRFQELNVNDELAKAAIYPLVHDTEGFNHTYPARAVRHLAARALEHWLQSQQ